MMCNRISIFLVAVGLACVATQASAAVIAQYRFENDLTSEVNFPALNATSGTGTGFSTDVPGALILDGVGGASVANVASYDQDGGAASTVTNSSLVNDTINEGSFTIEAFVKLDVGGAFGFDLIMGNLNGAGSQGWALGLDGGGMLRFGAAQANNGGFLASTATTALPVDDWVHVAAVGTFTDNTGSVDFTDVQLYIDYVATGTATRFFGNTASETGIGPVIVEVGANYGIGAGNAFDGLIDEIRLSDTALGSDDLLRASAIPEPSSVMLLGVGAMLMMFRRRNV